MEDCVRSACTVRMLSALAAKLVAGFHPPDDLFAVCRDLPSQCKFPVVHDFCSPSLRTYPSVFLCFRKLPVFQGPFRLRSYSGCMKDLFRRKELKYLLEDTRQQAFLAFLQDDLVADDFHDYRIQSVYLDTPDHRLLRQCARKPAYREKLRVRIYDNGQSYLEVKKKWQGITYKSRWSLSRVQLDSLLAGDPVECGGEAGRILQERWCIPVFTVQYHRRAWRWKGDPDLRITLDDTIQWQKGADPYRALLPADRYILEIKSSRPLPLELVHVMNRLELQPASVSKAGTAFQQLCLETAAGSARDQFRSAGHPDSLKSPAFHPEGGRRIPDPDLYRTLLERRQTHV